MSRPSANSTLYRLIQAGQLAHHALLAPLRERGLEPGDDAILFELGRTAKAETELADALGLSLASLTGRLNRLSDRELIVSQAVGAELLPGIALTDRGARIRDGLAENWAQLEIALLHELKPKHRKRLSQQLKRFIALFEL
jgi:DNA-binding MarR family transcriptional regulator